MWDEALLFRKLATLRTDVPVFDTVRDLQWVGPTADFEKYCRRLNSDTLLKRGLAAKTSRTA